VTFGGLRALDRVRLTVPPGDRRAVIGPNGAGKSTLLNVVCGLLRPSGGRILLDGRDITRSHPAERRLLGIARSFQISSVFEELSVGDNVRLAIMGVMRRPLVMIRRTSEALDETIHRVLSTVCLSGCEGKLARDLSYGQRRQLEIALALAAPCRLLLLDEPTSGLARSDVGRVVEILQQLPSALSLLLVEHNLDVVKTVANSVTVMHHGRVIREGTFEDVSSSQEVRRVYLGLGRDTR
jgi:branched-chain amino acid transport system ATP-binding protein